MIAVLFVAGDAISLIGPERFYSDVLTPSLVALVRVAGDRVPGYPRFRGRPSRLDWVAVAAATGLAVLVEVVIAQQPYA